MAPPDIEERVRAVERQGAVHENEIGTMKELVADLTTHLTAVNTSVQRLTIAIVVIAIVDVILRPDGTLAHLLGQAF